MNASFAFAGKPELIVSYEGMPPTPGPGAARAATAVRRPARRVSQASTLGARSTHVVARTKGPVTLIAASAAPSAGAGPRPGSRCRATFSAALLAAACLAAFAVLAAGAAAPASAGPYVNPSPAEIRAKLNAAAVARLIPPKILYGIAFQESTWRQFDANGDPLIGFDGKGIGIMQVTTIPLGVDVERLKTDIDYNIAVGADILVTKWGYAPSVFPVIGDGDPRCYENWFFAVWAYNGWISGNPYPYKVWGHIADGRGLWTGLAVTPVPTAWLVGGFRRCRRSRRRSRSTGGARRRCPSRC